MDDKNVKRNVSVTSTFGLVLLTTTCCALPILLVAFGLGGAMASLVSTLPWLVVLSKYKIITFSITGLALGYAWYQVKQINQSEIACDIRMGKILKWQRRILIFSSCIFFLSLIAAYVLLPVRIWLDI
jgi:mercuric ion transport protein